MDNKKILGMDLNTFIVVLLLVILGIVSFHYYAYLSTSNGLSAGAGIGVSLFPGIHQTKH